MPKPESGFSKRKGKDGNPLEVPMIASSIMNASGIFTADKAVTSDQAKPVPKLAIGDKLSLTAGRRLRQAGGSVLCRD
jgi:hypothetical protein